jgi:hypothetical protein
VFARVVVCVNVCVCWVHILLCAEINPPTGASMESNASGSFGSSSSSNSGSTHGGSGLNGEEGLDLLLEPSQIRLLEQVSELSE